MKAPTRKYSADVHRRKGILSVVVLLLFLAQIGMQTQIDPTAKEIHKFDASLSLAGSGLNNEFLLLPLLGFREAAAGLLWVRCDEFFHSGDYDAILPLVRIITWLDPHADNIFITGAWHLAYNFTDTAERSDRRYIGPAQALLDEGIINNPGIPDIKFEKGWQNFDKIKDYRAAETALQMALDTKPNKNSDDYPYGAPLKTWHLLAHVYERQGRLPEAIEAWSKALKRSDDTLAKNAKDYSTKQMRAAEQHNHDEDLQRWSDRYTTQHHSHTNATPYPAVFQPSADNKTPHAWDCAFLPQVDVTRPKVLKIHGSFNSADGARINVRIADWSYKSQKILPGQASFAIDLSKTILIDSIAVRKAKFEREIDMSKDPKMYGFNDDYYRITLWYDTRISSPHLQDRFGYSGEGITDSDASHVYIDPQPEMLGTKYIEGAGAPGPIWDGVTCPWPNDQQSPHIIEVTYKVTRDQMEGRKPITNSDIVPNTPY